MPQPLTRKILVVDDSDDSATSMAMLLGSMGHETQTAGDGAEAVRRAESFRPDVVLMDIGLPKMDGREAARTIRSQPWGRDICLIALSGWSRPSDIEASRVAGFDMHLVKPVRPADLLRVIDAAPPADRSAP